jgi:hypothetical protein
VLVQGGPDAHLYARLKVRVSVADWLKRAIYIDVPATFLKTFPGSGKTVGNLPQAYVVVMKIGIRPCSVRGPA